MTHKIGSGGGAGMAGNVLVGGIIGAGVDVASGAMYDLTPNPVDVVLEKEEAPPAVTPAAAPNARASGHANADRSFQRQARGNIGSGQANRVTDPGSEPSA